VITSISTPEPEEVLETTDVVIRGSPAAAEPTKKNKKRKSDGLEDVRERAGKISDAQIKKYWKAEEDSRLAPRSTFPSPESNPPLTSFLLVHQETVALPEKILRHFDLSSQYGPCIGIQRLRRWERASRLGLDPPIEVLAVLLKEEAKGDQRDAGRIAYIDELGGGKKVLVD